MSVIYGVPRRNREDLQLEEGSEEELTSGAKASHPLTHRGVPAPAFGLFG